MSRTSLMVQWVRICLPIQGAQVQSLAQEDSTSLRATKSVHPPSMALEPQLPKPKRLEPVLRSKRSPRSEKPTHNLRVAPALHN